MHAYRFIRMTESWSDKMAHACNPRYLGGRDQEDPSSKLAGEKVSKTPSQQKS
jgi:hypothetical protein